VLLVATTPEIELKRFALAAIMLAAKMEVRPEAGRALVSTCLAREHTYVHQTLLTSASGIHRKAQMPSL